MSAQVVLLQKQLSSLSLQAVLEGSKWHELFLSDASSTGLPCLPCGSLIPEVSAETQASCALAFKKASFPDSSLVLHRI